MVIGIHGGNSEGYEWIYPLWQLNQDSIKYFSIVGMIKDANANNAKLVNHIDTLLDNYSKVKKIKILSHSYGGTHLLYSLDLLSNASQTRSGS